MHVSSTARRIVLVALLAVVASANADVVRLKNGGKIEGQVVLETSTTVVVNSGSGKVSVDRALIESIERTPTPAPTTVTTRTGPHFRVSCHFEAGAFADEALASAEAAWPATIAAIGAAPAALERPMDIHVYRDPAEYAAVETKLTGGKMKDYGGFSDFASQSAHVLVRFGYDDVVWRRFGAPTFAIAAVAHEAAHLTAMTCAANGHFHPSWFAEGLAQHVERIVVAADADGARPGADVKSSGQMAACLRLRRSGLLPEPRAIVQERIDHLDVHDRYAVHWAFFEFLLRPEHRDRTDQLLAEMRGMAAGDDFGRRLSTIVEKLWGEKGLDDLNDAFRKHVDAFRPAWDVSGMFDVHGERWIEWADASAVGARVWRTAGVGRTDYRIAGAFEVVSGEARQVEVDLGHGDAGCVAVVFDARVGVWVSEYRAADKTWHDVQGGAVVRGPLGAKTEFEIHVVDGAIRVSVAGKEILATSPGGRDLSGPWGVGVARGTTAVWTGVTIQ